jgi:hypothetical protein
MDVNQEEMVRAALDACRTYLSRAAERVRELPLDQLAELLDHRAPELRDIPGWLLLGPELGQRLLGIYRPEPRAAELTALLRLVRAERPELLPLVRELVWNSRQASAAMVEIQLDQLVTIDEWSHPVQVLDRPRSDLRDLLAASRRRLRTSRGEEKARLITVRQRLERAVRIAEAARRRRARREGPSSFRGPGDDPIDEGSNEE